MGSLRPSGGFPSTHQRFHLYAKRVKQANSSGLVRPPFAVQFREAQPQATAGLLF
jgi:hypothetical protein